MEKSYLAIDLKSFYASCECVERGLDPLTARLVVADFSRTEKTICLAVSPALKAYGLSGRERLYEVLRVTKAHNLDFIAAPPQMQKYINISRQIYQIYTSFVAPEDIHVYSIDEVFIDATPYFKTYHLGPRELTEKIIHTIYQKTGITATAGIGTNLYLAKIAMDIKAKHQPADQHGVRIAELTEKTYREELWDHRPITDFWRIGPGYKRRLQNLGIHTMGELAHYSITGSDKLYATFGINAELLIDHAWGWEPVTIPDIKNYTSENHSLSQGQVLMHHYDSATARLVTWEMADALSLELFAKNLLTNHVTLTIGYDKDNPNFHGEFVTDFYGRQIPKPSHGSKNLTHYTSSSKEISTAILQLYDELCSKNLSIRRIMISLDHTLQRENVKNHNLMFFQGDLFTDYDKLQKSAQKEARLQAAALAIKKRYGKNAILKAANFEDGATMRERNHQIGGHHA